MTIRLTPQQRDAIERCCLAGLAEILEIQWDVTRYVRVVPEDPLSRGDACTARLACTIRFDCEIAVPGPPIDIAAVVCGDLMRQGLLIGRRRRGVVGRRPGMIWWLTVAGLDRAYSAMHARAARDPVFAAQLRTLWKLRQYDIVDTDRSAASANTVIERERGR